MLGRILIFVLLFSLVGFGQESKPENVKSPPGNSPQKTDELFEHLAAAENFQRSGNLPKATIENRAVLAIGLQRLGKIAIEEGKYADAAESLTDSLQFADTAPNRTNLAIAYMRQNILEKALAEARIAKTRDPQHIGARYILGNILYAREDYEQALPELEIVFRKTPDFEVGRALGFTYLSLKKIEEAQKHFELLASMVKKETAALRILFAKFYERTNYPGHAERELRRALELEPNRPKTNLYLGYLLMKHSGSERFDDAGKAFEQELKITPNDFQALFFAGVVATTQKNPEKAIPLLKKAVSLNPKSGEAHLFLGQSHMDLDQFEEAENNLRRAVALEKQGGKNTQARRTHFLLGRLLLKTGRKEEGRKELKIAGELQKKALDSSRSEINRILGQVAGDAEIETEEDKPITSVEIDLPAERVEQLGRIKTFLREVVAQAYNNLGVIETQNGNLPTAMDRFSKAQKWNPALPNVDRNLGIVAFRTNAFDKAIDPLKRQLEVNSQDVLVRKMLGISYYLTKDFARSVETLSPFGESIINDGELAYFYGTSLVRLKRDKEASQVFEALSGASTQDREKLFYAAQGFMTLRDYERAILEFNRVLKLAPDTPKANYYIGQSLIRLNRSSEAETFFVRELELSPKDAKAKYHLALTLIERQVQIERAIRHLKEAIELQYGYADAYYQLGKIYLAQGKFQDAVTELERAVLADSTKDYIHYQLSIAYRKVARTSDAERELEIYKRLKEEKRKNESPMPMGPDTDSPGM